MAISRARMRRGSKRRNRRAALIDVAENLDASVEIHTRQVVVWDVPQAIECGAPFSIKIGVKCSSECASEAWLTEVRDDAGNTLATAALGTEPWNGTAALYFAEVALVAPDAEGLHAWEVRVPAIEGGIAHNAVSEAFGVRTVPASECLMTVVAIDKESQTPLEGARVVAHPYRAATDERGIAELRVPKGPHRVFVSARNYLPFRCDREVTADTTIRADLDIDVGPSDADIWS
jgi:hypothetical protein